MNAMEMDYNTDEEEDFHIGPFRKYDTDILKRCMSFCNEDGVPHHNLGDVGTITGYADGEYTSSRLVEFIGIKKCSNSESENVTLDTVGLILCANLWLHMLMDDPETAFDKTMWGLSTRYNLDELGWILASHLGCSTETIHDMLLETMKYIHVEQYYADKCKEIASCSGVQFKEGERLSLMIEVLIRSPVLIEPGCLYSIINYKLMKWLGVPYVDDNRYDQILNIIKEWGNNPIGISPLAHSNKVEEYKYQNMSVQGVLPNKEIRKVVVFTANKDIQKRFQVLPGYDTEAHTLLVIDGDEWLGVAHVSYRWTCFKKGSVGTDLGAYTNHLTLYPLHANLLTMEGTRSNVPLWLYMSILKDVNMARCRMYQGPNEGYSLTRKTEIGGEGGMWSHMFDNRGGYPKRCIATRHKVGRNENTYVKMRLEDDRDTMVQVEDRGVRKAQVQQKDGLTGKNQLPKHFKTDLIKRLINGDGMTMNGDTTVNVSAHYAYLNAPLKIAHLAMAYTRIRSAIEDVSNSFSFSKTEVIDYHRNANSFIVLLNVLLMDKPPLKLKTLGDGCIMVDVFNVEAKMEQMGILPEQQDRKSVV